MKNNSIIPSGSFPHHRLKVWHKAVELVRLVKQHPLNDAELRSQSSRAACSVALNIAEGAGLEGKARLKHFRIARGSLVEVVAAYELAELTECYPNAGAIITTSPLMSSRRSPSSGIVCSASAVTASVSEIVVISTLHPRGWAARFLELATAT